MNWLQWAITMHYRRLTLLVLLIVPAAVWQSQLYAQGLPDPLSPPVINSWLQQNVLAIAVLVFHFGVSWREFLDHRRRITDLEKRLDGDVPETYLRTDVFNARFDGLRDELRGFHSELSEWRETFSFLRRRDDRRGGPHV